MFLDELHDVTVVIPDFSVNETVLGRQQLREMFLLVQGMNTVISTSGNTVLG